MTANVLERRSDPDSLDALIERLDPDIVFLEEMSEVQARVIERRFDHHFLFPSERYEGRGVASKPPAECGSLDLPWRPGTWVKLAVGGREVVGAGVHMPNPIQFPWWRSVRQRRDQADALFAWIEEQEFDALIVAGDLNASPAWPLYRRIAAQLEDLAESAAHAEGSTPERTWGWRPGWPRLLRIDHVFGSGVTATRTRVEPISGSDHHAVIVDIEV